MRQPRRPPAFLLPDSEPWFPDPCGFDGEGLVAIGGDVSTKRLLYAYERGIFPWYAEGILPMWWSPDPRCVLERQDLHQSRSLRRTIRRGGFELSWNRCFARVMAQCGKRRDEGTWVIPEMLRAYERLHRTGHAHSLEVWRAGALVGGIYGVQVGGLFAAESMFHRCTDMSKVALVALVQSVCEAGIELFDVQFLTPHLESLGGREISRADYLSRLEKSRASSVELRELPIRL